VSLFFQKKSLGKRNNEKLHQKNSYYLPKEAKSGKEESAQKREKGSWHFLKNSESYKSYF